MDLQASLELALVNLTSPPVLAFVLGLIAVAVRADLRLPDAVYQATSMYLLLAIGIKGGVALREASPGEIAWPGRRHDRIGHHHPDICLLHAAFDDATVARGSRRNGGSLRIDITGNFHSRLGLPGRDGGSL